MPNTIKYNASTEANALRVGNFYIGVRDVSKGPTSITGFYNGINPPSSGYTIYQNKASQGPSIICPSDDEQLIIATNGIAGASYTTINECFGFFANTNDKIVMHNPINTIVTDDLVACFMAGTIPSYPRQGTTWYDISVEDNDGTLTNSPTFNPNGWMEFDGVDDKISVGNPTKLNFTTNMSCEAVFRRSSNAVTNLRLLSKGGGGASTSQNGFSYFGSNTSIAFACTNNAVRNIQSATITTDKWYHVVGIIDQTSNKQKVWLNGVLTNSVTLSGTGTMVGTADFNIGMFGNSSLPWDGDIESVRIYGKALTDAEVLQNYFQGPIVTDDLKFAIDPGNLISFQEGTTIAYNQTGSVNGTLTNGVSFSSAANGVWDFDGIDDMIDTPSLTGTDLEFLSNPSDTGGLTYSIWSKNDSSSSYYLLSTGSQTSSTGVALSYQAGSGFVSLDTGTKNMSFGISSYWPLNEWVHFTFVQDELTWYFYKNGIQIGTGGINGTSTASDLQTKLRIAGPNNSTCCRFDGQVGSVLVYDRALTAGEVAQNYNANVNRFN